MKTLKYVADSYILTITSWENDGDNYNTKEKVVDSLQMALAVFDFCQIFNEHGNICDPSTKQLAAINAEFVSFAADNPIFFGDEQPIDDEHTEQWCIDTAYDLGLACGEQYTRQLDKVVVQHILQDVYVEDVTESFFPIKINHRPAIAEVDAIAKHYSEKDGVPVHYVCTSEINGNNIACDIFYRDTPHPEFGNKYFALYRPGNGGLRIASADSIEDETFSMVDNAGTWEYSRYRHDYYTFATGSVDGGRSYFRGSTNSVAFVIRSGKFVRMEN